MQYKKKWVTGIVPAMTRHMPAVTIPARVNEPVTGYESRFGLIDPLIRNMPLIKMKEIQQQYVNGYDYKPRGIDKVMQLAYDFEEGGDELPEEIVEPDTPRKHDYYVNRNRTHAVINSKSDKKMPDGSQNKGNRYVKRDTTKKRPYYKGVSFLEAVENRPEFRGPYKHSKAFRERTHYLMSRGESGTDIQDDDFDFDSSSDSELDLEGARPTINDAWLAEHGSESDSD